MKKLVSFVLVFALIACLFSGCSVDLLLDYSKDIIKQLLIKETPREEDTSWSETLVYTLDQQMVDAFDACLAEARELSVSGPDWQSVEESITALDDAYMALIDQNQIAYVLYCLDQSDETRSQQYTDSTDILTQAELAYNNMARDAYLSDSPYKDQLFEGWTQEEIDRMLKHDDEIAQLESRNTQIVVEYRELGYEDFDENMVKLYNELVSNNNRIAQIYGYADYYTYATAMVYSRDYDMQALEQLRSLGVQYLPQIYLSAVNAFNTGLEQLSDVDINLLNQLLGEDYDLLEPNYVQSYLEAAPENMSQDMLSMFRDKRVAITYSENAFQGAFTTAIGGKPFCYFGPGYHDSSTVIHELGHYYAALYNDIWMTPMDLCETQSQGNEWLFIQYLDEHMSPQMHEVFVEFRVVNDICYDIIFLMVDTFEQLVYTHENAGNLTLQEYNDLMAQVAKAYGGIDYVEENIGDVQQYWKMVVLESPVYYVSYAVSGIASMELFTLAQEDETAAWEAYRKLVEDADVEQGFLWNLQQAGLAGPFAEEVYQSLLKRYEK